ncbi:hypothetical protein ACFV3R_09870 [Streptomyces sp. NPDC059740]|uniref:hypothetical protein n=1 Tax=Streptomyces sp. NPDC059740 TaxID=3346926 RepID=UPI0036550C74
MPSTTITPALSPLELAAITAALIRARTGRPARVEPDPRLHRGSDDVLAWVERVLRLSSLGRPIAIHTEHDRVHPLLPGGQYYRAAVLTIPSEGRALNFLATYDERRRLVFDLVDRCPHCRQSVPTQEINCFEDLGDYLLQARDARGGSPRFRYSSAHEPTCPARGN